MSEQATFGTWLKNRRNFLDLTQDELAERVGCSFNLIRKIEADERRPSKQIAEIIAIHLKIPADERSDFVRFARSKSACFAPDDKAPWRAHRRNLTNLPAPPTRLIGREQEIDAIVRQVVQSHTRLLTLVGPPGIGKTRLAMACAEELLERFDDGTYFIALAPLRDPDLLASTIARALGATEMTGQSVLQSLTQHLATKRALLVLDNFEQIVASAPLVAELLTSCPWLYLLATSRVSLHLRAERQFRVTPLALPPLSTREGPEKLLRYPAIEFFVDRARSVDPTFRLSTENSGAIVQLCARLDGLALAIELVATRMDEHSPQELLAQMERRLPLVAVGPRDLPSRHQTLRDAIAWSDDLLDPVSRSVFARAAIFVDGWTSEMARAICGGDITEAEVMHALSTLHNSSLLVEAKEADGKSRWSMLETIREYAAERLASLQQTEGIAKHHAFFFLVLAESAAPHLSGPDQVEWLNRLEREHGNLHAAVEWAIECGDVELALRLGNALYLYWYKQNWLDKGRTWLKRALALPATRSVAPSLRQRGLNNASFLAWAQADFAEAEQLGQESYALAREIGDRRTMAEALHNLANVAADRSDYARAIALHEQNLALWRELEEKARIASSLNNLGRIAYYRGDAAQAIRYHEESLALQRELSDHFGIVVALNNLGADLADNLQELDRAASLLQEGLALAREPGTSYFLITFMLAHLGRIALYAGDLDHAQATLEEALKIAREEQSRTGTAFASLFLAQLHLQRGSLAQAASLLQEGLEVQRGFEDQPSGPRYLSTMAAFFCARQQWSRAAKLIGATAGLCEKSGKCLPPAALDQYAAAVSLAHAQMDEQAYQAAYERGYTMTLAQALDFASGSVTRSEDAA